MIWTWSSTEEFVAFVDGDKEDSEPDDMLIKERVQIIMASPPRDASERWIKQIRRVKILATSIPSKLWSPRELFLLVAGLFLGLLLSTLD